MNNDMSLEQRARELPFQQRVDEWLIARYKAERNHRFLEEALELVQAAGCTASEAHQLVDYTFGRPIGEIGQEVGGVMNTLAALCLAHDLDMAAEGDREMARVWTKVDAIREKQRNKPKHSPLPQHVEALTPKETPRNDMSDELVERLRAKRRRYDLETGGGSISTDGVAKTWTNGQVWEAINPDGAEAADEIERLRARVATLSTPSPQGVLREALEPFARVPVREAAWPDDYQVQVYMPVGAESGLCLRDFRRAREALSSLTGETE